MSEEMIVKNGAPTLSGLKSGSLFSCPCASRSRLTAELAAANRVLTKKGLRVIWLRLRQGRALIYLYRPELLRRDLARPEAARLLREAGYDDPDPRKCLAELIRRLRRGGPFPHEIGLFLGYPVEDVRGFMEQGADKSRYSGLWQVYGDVEQARCLFAAYKSCTARCLRCYNSGTPLEALAVALN